MAQLVPIAEYCKRCPTPSTPAVYRVYDGEGLPVEDTCRRHATGALDEQLKKEAGQQPLPDDSTPATITPPPPIEEPEK